MPRTAVLPQKIKDILESVHMLSVAEILEILEKNGDTFNKTSVYRTLEKMQESGEVCRESFGDSEFLYELRKEHHDHAVCNLCEKIISIACRGHSYKTIPGFKPDHHHTTVYGICEDCLAK